MDSLTMKTVLLSSIFAKLVNVVSVKLDYYKIKIHHMLE